MVEWYKANNVVSEFIRFSLNDNHVGYPGEITDTMKNVKGVILNQENQWKNFEHKVRKNVKRALNEGLKVTIKKGKDVTHDEISEFSDIYIHTMERTKANEGFFYNDSVFRNFVLKKPSDCAFSFVYDDGKCISTEFVLLNNEVMFSFLGGTLSHSFNKRPNDLLKFELINWCINTGLKFYVLGGGYGLDDGIFNYKKSFFPNDVITFKTGRRIIHRKIYDELIAIANKKRIGQGKDTLDNHRDSFFPLYRFSDH
jgi:predicted N-acyltransferase